MPSVFNLGNVFGQAEAIKAARNRNVLAGINIQAAKRKERNLTMVRQARQQFDNGGEIVRQLREAGEHDAADMFVGTQIAEKLNQMNLVRALAPMIQDATTYERLRGELIQDGAIEEDTLPVNYDESVFKRLNSKFDKDLARFRLDVEKFGFEREKFSAIEERERKKLGLEARKTATGEARARIAARAEARLGREKTGVKTSTSRLVYQQAAGAFGGIIDPRTGNISGLNKTQAADVARVAAQAERYVAQGLDPNAAVQKALVDEGVQGAAPRNNDPLGIRGR